MSTTSMAIIDGVQLRICGCVRNVGVVNLLSRSVQSTNVYLPVVHNKYKYITCAGCTRWLSIGGRGTSVVHVRRVIYVRISTRRTRRMYTPPDIFMFSLKQRSHHLLVVFIQHSPSLIVV